MAAPYVSQDPQEVSRLLVSLELGRKEKRRAAFSVKKTTFEVKESKNGIQVDSWRMQEWDYKRWDLPTYARGLFTTRTQSQSPEIAVRGYDKFFNVGEVHQTKWENIMARTQPPYELTLKENGCIIFIAGLEDDTLLVCSKHSTGDRADAELSHASAGKRRLEQQLRAIGKTSADLARELRWKNVTAVAELCDDSFEEHILAYGPEKAGLYLHGMNLNLPEFATYPSNLVQGFADSWGFRKIGLMVMDNIQQVKAFLENVAESGAYEGRDVEGFVIRCHMTHDPEKLPYQDWFFKYKFEEPYLMYRQWRECTKALISGKQPKFKKHTKITEEYLLYARNRLKSDPLLATRYNHNHGIIALRDDFLRFKNLNGPDAANFGDGDPITMTEVTKDVVITPIATIGCGKTTVAQGLSHLFNWGHVQNDNISGKGRPPKFVKTVVEQLSSHPAVFADRNNAQKHERKQLITDIKLQHFGAKLVCLHFRHDDDSIADIRRVTQQRVLDRGDNHQTIHAATDQNKFLGIMEGFIQRLEPCDPQIRPDDGFDVVIDLDPVAGSRKNLETVVTQLRSYFPNLIETMPTTNQFDEAIKFAINYKPDLRHDIPKRGNRDKNTKPQAQDVALTKKKRQLEYMAVELPSSKINAILEEVFKHSDAPTSRFYMQLKQTRRIQPTFHVTLIHRATSSRHHELWHRYQGLCSQTSENTDRLGNCDVLLERVVFDDRIMAVVVRLINKQNQWECVNRVAHITVGTRDQSVKPKESNDLLERWLDIGISSDGSIRELQIDNKPTVPGVVKGVLSR